MILPGLSERIHHSHQHARKPFDFWPHPLASALALTSPLHRRRPRLAVWRGDEANVLDVCFARRVGMQCRRDPRPEEAKSCGQVIGRLPERVSGTWICPNKSIPDWVILRTLSLFGDELGCQSPVDHTDIHTHTLSLSLSLFLSLSPDCM